MNVELTFDDGPDPVWTPRVLDVLAAHDVRATFFVMGGAAERFPDAVRATVAAGHDVQLHCHEHRRHTTVTRAELEADTDRAIAVLARLGVTPTRWRAPWGVLAPFTAEVAAARGLELVHWTDDTEDWGGDPALTLLSRVTVRPGAIVLMHDGLGPGARRAGCAETVALVGLLVAAARGCPPDRRGLPSGPAPLPHREVGAGC